MEDYFDYALKLTTGEVIQFASAEIHGDYVRLIGHGGDEGGFQERDAYGHPRQLPHPFPRGLDVRLDQIVWCADAPDGS